MSGRGLGQLIGGAAGYYFFGPLGGMIGSIIGNAIDPPKGPTIHGPRLNDLSVQTSTYGAAIPRVYGTIAVHGNVFWLENNQLKEVVKKSKEGGKGGGPVSKVYTYTYYATFAVGLCKGPIQGVRRIWVGPKLIYDAGSDDLDSIVASNQSAKGFRIYYGTDDQLPDARIQADRGVDNTPAYRGLAYIVFYDLPLADFGNALPAAQIKVEVSADAEPPSDCPYIRTLDENLPTVSAGGLSQISVAHDNGTLLTGRIVDGSIHVERRTLSGQIIGLDKIITFADGLTPWLPARNWPYSYFAFTTPRHCVVFNNGVRCNVEGRGYGRAIIQVGDTTYAFYGGYIRAIKIVTDTSSGEAGAVVVAQYGPGGETDIHCGLSTDGEVIYAYINRSGYNDLIELDLDLNEIKRWSGFQLPGLTQGGRMPWPIARRVLYGSKSADGNFRSVLTLNDDGTITESCLGPLGSSVSFVRPQGLNIWYSPTNVFIPGDTPLVEGNSETLSDIVSAECLLSEVLEPSDIDASSLTDEVEGYMVANPGAIRGGIDPLQAAWPFDIIQSGYQVAFRRRGGSPVLTITADELGARPAGASFDRRLVEQREMALQLPSAVHMTYLDRQREYDVGEQRAERFRDSHPNQHNLELPIVMTADGAAQKAEVLLHLWWLERTDLEFELSPEYLALEPADVIKVVGDWGEYELRLTEIHYQSDGVQKCRAKFHSASVYVSDAKGDTGDSPEQSVGLEGPSDYVLLDVPAVVDTMDDPGFLSAMTGFTDAWPGGILFRTPDDGQTWTDIQAFAAPVTMGRAENVIGTWDFNVIDPSNVLEVRLFAGDLESVSELAMLNGANHFAYGDDGRWEIIGVMNCEEDSDGIWHLSDMLRGRFGTEWAASLHQPGDRVVLLNDPDVAFIAMSLNTVGIPFGYRGITSNATIDSDATENFTYRGVNMKPLSPVYLNGERGTNGDWTLTWVRRTRINGEWRDNVDVPVAEETEAYEIDIVSSDWGTVIRTLKSTMPSVTYTSAQQVEDFGSNQSELNLRIYQMSARVGRGYPLEQTIARQRLWTPLNMVNPPKILLDWNSSVTNASGNASQWNDRSGNGYHYTQGTSGRRPAILNGELNGLRVLSFDGVDDSLINQSAQAVMRNVSAGWGFSVYKKRTQDTAATTIPNRTLIQFSRGGGTSRYSIQVSQASTGEYNKSYISVRPLDDSEVSALRRSSTPRFGDWVLGYWAWDGANDSMQIIENGGTPEDFSSLGIASTTSNTQSNSVPSNIGCSQGSTGTRAAFADIDIACVVVGSGSLPTEDEIDRLFGWAAWELDLVNELPIGHPYKDNPPFFD